MELRRLEYVLAVAEELNFTRGAERCFVSQSALSQQIQKLENELGTLLFERQRGQVRLTPAGEVVCYHARQILRELNDARLAIQDLDGLKRGTLTIGTVQTVNAYLIPCVVAQFTQAHPGIQLRVEEHAASDIERGLQAGAFQIGIGFVPAENKNIETRFLMQEELALIVARNHPLAARASVAFRELQGVALAHLSTAFCTRRLLDRHALETGFSLSVTLEMNTIGGLLNTVLRTGLATVLPRLALAGRSESGLIGIALREPTPHRQIGLLQRRGGYRCAATRAFVDILTTVISEDKLAGGIQMS